MGLIHREQPKSSEVCIRPLLMIAQAAPPAGSMLLAAQDRPQATADKAVEGREGITMGVLEVAKPPLQDRIERRDNACDMVTAIAFPQGTDFVLERGETLLANPALPGLKAITRTPGLRSGSPRCGSCPDVTPNRSHEPKYPCGPVRRSLPPGCGLTRRCHPRNHHEPRLPHLDIQIVQVDVGQ